MTITKEPPLTAEEAQANARMALATARDALDRLDGQFAKLTSEQQAAAAVLSVAAARAAMVLLYPREKSERYAALRLIDDGPDFDKEAHLRASGLLAKGLLDMWNERDDDIRPRPALACGRRA